MALVVTVAGLVRGFTGFGAGLFMAPLLAGLLGPREAVPLLILLDGLVSAVLLPGALPRIEARELVRLAVPAALAIAPGSLVLTAVDPVHLRVAISAVVLATVAVLASGWRRRHAPGHAATSAIGAASGLLTGAAGIGGPPVILFLLSGGSPSSRVRAQLIGFFGVTQAAAVLLLSLRGLISAGTLLRASEAAPLFLLGAWSGSRLFGRREGRGYRTAAYLLLAGSAVAGLAAPWGGGG